MKTGLRGFSSAGIAAGHDRWSNGFTLIEILVTLLISAFLLSGVISISLSSQRSYLVKEHIGRLQENMQLSAEILRRTLSMAESLHQDSNTDRIIASYPGDVGVVNCLGTEVTSGLAVNHFYVSNNTLYCGAAYPATPGSDQPLVDGVARMTVRYGIDENHRGQVDRYVEAPGDWNQVISTRLSLQLQNSASAPGTEVVLTVAMRPRVLSRLP